MTRGPPDTSPAGPADGSGTHGRDDRHERTRGLESGVMRKMHVTMTVDVGGVGADGCAWAIADGRRVSIENAIPGERAEIAVTETPGGRLVGRVTRFIRTSLDRVEPACRHFGPCGGCTWQHIGYEAQLRLKHDLVQTLLDDALGSAAPRVAPAVASRPWGFRDKIHFVFAPASRTGGLVMGHYRRGSQTVVSIDECPVHAPAGNRVAFAVRDALERREIPAVTTDLRHGLVRHLIVRVSEATGRRGATLVVRRNDAALRPAVRAVLAGADAPARPASCSKGARRPLARTGSGTRDRGSGIREQRPGIRGFPIPNPAHAMGTPNRVTSRSTSCRRNGSDGMTNSRSCIREAS